MGRNKRSVWTIATQPFPEAHFATFPMALAEPCIKAGTSERGCCSSCGAPWRRIVEQQKVEEKEKNGKLPQLEGGHGTMGHDGAGRRYSADYRVETRTLGWKPTCKCGAAVSPCTVLDPFSGAGTTAMTAADLGRHGIGIELNPDYVELSKRRIERAAPLLNFVEVA